MTTKTTRGTKTDEQLESEANALVAKQHEIAAERERRAREAEAKRQTALNVYRREVLAKAPGLEEELEASSRVHFDAARAALLDGDLTKAYAEWVAYNRDHRVRAQVRTRAQGAAHALGERPHTTADLRMDRGTFIQFLSGNEVPAWEHGLGDRVNALLGEEPTE